MRRGDDGSVELDLGRLGGVSEGLVVTYEKHGCVVGRSVPRRRPAHEPSLESRVLEARNTVFAQELWHELTREARTLAAYDVRLEPSRLTMQVDGASKVSVELLPLESCPDPDPGLPDNATADMMALSLQMLLGYAHQYNERTRIRPIPPHISRSRGQHTHALLRPIIARFKSIHSTQTCVARIGGLVKALVKAGLPSSFTLRTPQPSTVDPGAGGPNQQSSALTLVRNMLQPLEFAVKLTILPDTWLTIRARTFLFPFTATYYHVLLPPSSPLQAASPPFADGYSTLRSLTEYVQVAVARTLAARALEQCRAAAAGGAGGGEWMLDVLGTAVQDAAAARAGMRFAVRDVDARPAVVVGSVPPGEGSSPGGRCWEWACRPAADGGADAAAAEGRALDDVVTELARSAAPP